MNLQIYNLMTYFMLPVALLRLLIKSLKSKSYRQRIAERLGFVDKTDGATIWVHCVSVGEFMAAISLIDELIKIYPKHKILVTSITVTGSNAIIKHYKNKVLHFYFPFDLVSVVSRYIKMVKPQMCILLETEIWPNLINILYKNNIPVILTNARLSVNSFKKYYKFSRNFSKQTLAKLTAIATQDKQTREHFIRLGVDVNKIKLTGNMKFEQNLKPDKAVSKELEIMTYKRKVVVFASTHNDEEEQIINSYKRQHIKALLVIIPRHPERFNKVYKLVKKHNLIVTKRSYNKSCDNVDILIGDSMGEMMSYFDICDIAFIGGSLNNTGGHNMLEAAALAKAIIFGPNVFNFAAISSALLANEAAIQVSNADELFTIIEKLLVDSTKCKKLGANAKQYFLSKQGATFKTIELIRASSSF